MNIGRIAYLNCEPFFHFWPSDGFTLVHGAPRELAQKAAEGLVDAGPLPIVECWKLENDFEPLGKWSIASRLRSGSVFLLSRRPIAELKGATIGLTHDSSTSVMLCELLLRSRYGLDVKLKRGHEQSDDAWLVIGDQALGLKLKNAGTPWSTVTDLATEWWNWQKKPFVFARWVARKTLSPGDHARLEWFVGESLDRGLASLGTIAEAAALKTGFPAELLERYFADFMFELDAEAEEGARAFKNLLEQAGILPAPAHR